MYLADLPSPTADEVFAFLKVIAAATGIYYLVLMIVQAHRRKPPLEEILNELASKKELQALQINVMPREEVEGEVARLDAYVHDMRHELKTDLQNITSKIDENIDAMRATVTTVRSELEARRSQGIAVLHQQLKGAEIQLAAVKNENQTHTALIAQLAAQIERMPERIKTLLLTK
jgi:uncharacterized protein YnzC (UPF0291/DUF896 family)